ncbi:hypothetical protein AGMMS49942_16650 [Spirochaetia bacterium]|nr:hypothetical protein AGMMS49942_16650 [Spirochaetia bacterium]
MHSDLIPMSGIFLYPFFLNIMTIIMINAPAWGISTALADALQAGIAPFMQAWLVFITPNSGKVDRDNMNVALKAARTLMATFARTHLLYNPLISDAQKAQMGFGPKPKPASGWSNPPILWVETAIRRIKFRFKGSESARQGKAVGAKYLEFRFKRATDRPLSVDDYTGVEIASGSPLVITCTEEQRRTRIWFWARWVANTNEKGIWSEMYPVYFT